MRILCLALLQLANLSQADDVNDALTQSSFAGVVTIYAGNQIPYKGSELSNCGSGYVAYASAKRVFVNNIEWTEGFPIEFRAGSTLALGGTYLVFLNEVATKASYANPIDREVRSRRCMAGGISLVPILVNTGTLGLEAVFQEWRIEADPDSKVGVEYLNYFLASKDLRNFFRTSHENGHISLEPISMEIREFYGLTKPDAYESEAVLKLVADNACDLRDLSGESTNELQIASCER